jgi:hypothetical protein
MSEAMTNSEIEDVLSSIRRLVAQEVRPPTDRLVLTAEHRVAQAGQHEAPLIEAVRAVASDPSGQIIATDASKPSDPDTSGDDSADRPNPADSAVAAVAPDRATDTVETEDTLIDEAELARLIARLVREELHGQLGEKITLQVRKLVRAEIARALDERNLIG